MLQEGVLLGTRIQWYLEQQEKLETFGIGASGAVWALVLTQDTAALASYLIWLPGFISVAMGVKSTLFTRTLNEAMQYLFELEEKLRLPAGMGWVHYFRARSSRYKRRWRYGFWASLAILNFALAGYVTANRTLVAKSDPDRPTMRYAVIATATSPQRPPQ